MSSATMKNPRISGIVVPCSSVRGVPVRTRRETNRAFIAGSARRVVGADQLGARFADVDGEGLAGADHPVGDLHARSAAHGVGTGPLDVEAQWITADAIESGSR